MPESEKQIEIREQIARLSTNFDNLTLRFDQLGDNIAKQMEDLSEKLSKANDRIVGNGRIGLVTRIDRLEQKEKSRGRLTWFAVSSSVTFIIGLLVKRLFF